MSECELERLSAGMSHSGMRTNNVCVLGRLQWYCSLWNAVMRQRIIVPDASYLHILLSKRQPDSHVTSARSTWLYWATFILMYSRPELIQGSVIVKYLTFN